MPTGDVSRINRQKDCQGFPDAVASRYDSIFCFEKLIMGAALMAVWFSMASAAAQKPADASPAPASVSKEAGAKENAPPNVPQATTAGAPSPALPSFLSRSKRDPFKSPLDKAKLEKQPEVEVIDVPPPRNRRPQGPAGWLISEVRLLGIVQGMGTKVAMVSGGGSITYFLHESERLYDGSIREIGDSYVKFVRDIKSNNIVVRQQEVTVSVQPAP
jgi:hypothetical protein